MTDITGDINLSTLISPNSLKGTDNWTLDHERILQKYSNKAKFYQALYNETNNYYSRWEMGMTIPLVIFTSITIILQILVNLNIDTYIPIAASITMGISAIINIYQK